MDTTLIAISAFFSSVFLLVVLGIFLVHMWGKPLFEGFVERAWSHLATGLVARVDTLEAEVEQLPRTWEEFAVDAKKIHDRTRWHIRRVKKELQERGLSDQEIDTLDGTLRPVDGGGGEEGQLQLLQDPVAEVLEAPQEAWMTRALRRKYGNG